MFPLRRHRGPGRPPHPDVLTPAEWPVLEHIREGRTNGEIAGLLGVSVNTVRTHVSSMLTKLEVPDRHALAEWQGEPAAVSRRHLRLRLPLPAWLARRPDGVAAAGRVVVVGALVVAGAAALLFGISGARTAGSVPATLTPTATPMAAATSAPTEAPAPEPTSTATPDPTPTPPPLTATPPAQPTATVEPTAEPTAAAPSPTPSPTASAPPASVRTEGAPWSMADVLAALAERDIVVSATGRTLACDAVGGAAGAEFDGDVRFALWIYPDASAVDAEWVHSGISAQHRHFECNRPPADVVYNTNAIMWIPWGQARGSPPAMPLPRWVFRSTSLLTPWGSRSGHLRMELPSMVSQ